ncbi:hypothetical protein GT23_1082 [Parageobacillus thermoglucosidasius]|nr:hypothetical protein GT23_1082 [Parageobacillus thermoglucosidasius]
MAISSCIGSPIILSHLLLAKQGLTKCKKKRKINIFYGNVTMSHLVCEF